MGGNLGKSIWGASLFVRKLFWPEVPAPFHRTPQTGWAWKCGSWYDFFKKSPFSLIQARWWQTPSRLISAPPHSSRTKWHPKGDSHFKPRLPRRESEHFSISKDRTRCSKKNHRFHCTNNPSSCYPTDNGPLDPTRVIYTHSHKPCPFPLNQTSRLLQTLVNARPCPQKGSCPTRKAVESTLNERVTHIFLTLFTRFPLRGHYSLPRKINLNNFSGCVALEQILVTT